MINKPHFFHEPKPWSSQVAEAAEIPGAWLSLEKAAKLLGELPGELKDGSLLAAGRDLLAPRAAMLMEEHMVRRCCAAGVISVVLGGGNRPIHTFAFTLFFVGCEEL